MPGSAWGELLAAIFSLTWQPAKVMGPASYLATVPSCNSRISQAPISTAWVTGVPSRFEHPRPSNQAAPPPLFFFHHITPKWRRCLLILFCFFFLSIHRDIVDNTKLHIDILDELLRNGNWGEFMPPIPSPNPRLPPRKLLAACLCVRITFLCTLSFTLRCFIQFNVLLSLFCF